MTVWIPPVPHGDLPKVCSDVEYVAPAVGTDAVPERVITCKHCKATYVLSPLAVAISYWRCWARCQRINCEVK